MIQAQRFRDLLTIQQATEARDAYGQPVATWATWKQIYGQLWPVSGRERFLSAQTQAETNYRARIRWIEGLTTKMRISHNGKFFGITYIADDGRRTELVLDLVEGLIDG